MSGDRIFIPGMTLFAEALPFQIVSTKPKGIVQVLPSTEIVIKEDPVDEEDESIIQSISYEDIGGLGDQLQKVREMIEPPETPNPLPQAWHRSTRRCSPSRAPRDRKNSHREGSCR